MYCARQTTTQKEYTVQTLLQLEHEMKYIIEHMDPELWEWSRIEYQHAADAVGKYNFMVTNLKAGDEKKLPRLDCRQDTIDSLGLKKVCVLDPTAENILSPSDASKFDHLVFGGILGNYPPEERTKDLIVAGADRRQLGPDQFSTDNAVMVAKQIIDGTPLEHLSFTQDLVIAVEEGEDSGEEIILPFKYILIEGKPFISPKIIAYVKKHGF